MPEEADVAVIGGGVVGLALAAELSRTRGVVLLERHEACGRENSSHNSGVVHAGIYYPPGWLKTRLCIEGNALLYQWSQRYGVRAGRTGKLIIATTEDEVSALEQLVHAARENGVPDLEMLSTEAVRQLEPSVSAVAAILSRSTGVVDQMELLHSLLRVAQDQGTMVALKHTVTAASRVARGFTLSVLDPAGGHFNLRATAIVNSAGLAADRVAAMLSYPLDGGPSSPRLRQTVNKGRYYDVVNPAKASLLSHLVYPLPHADRAALGVHVTLDIDGGVHLGPDSEWLADGATLDYRSDDTRRGEFLAAARRYLPWLESEDLMPGQVGYRTKLYGPGEEPRDFLIWHDRGYVHLGGIESPGMTASLAIARHVGQLLGAGPA